MSEFKYETSKFEKCWNSILIGVGLICLLLSLTSCVTLPAPPAQYLDDCTVTYLAPDAKGTNGELFKLASDREMDVARCNVDKRSLRAWYEGYCAATPKFCRWRKD